MRLPPVTGDDRAPQDGAVDDAEFQFDMRVVEATTPLPTMTCDTSDGCGSTCATTACITSSNDPW